MRRGQLSASSRSNLGGFQTEDRLVVRMSPGLASRRGASNHTRPPPRKRKSRLRGGRHDRTAPGLQNTAKTRHRALYLHIRPPPPKSDIPLSICPQIHPRPSLHPIPSTPRSTAGIGETNPFRPLLPPSPPPPCSKFAHTRQFPRTPQPGISSGCPPFPSCKSCNPAEKGQGWTGLQDERNFHAGLFCTKAQQGEKRIEADGCVFLAPRPVFLCQSPSAAIVRHIGQMLQIGKICRP